jgi:enoyl-CoA hydratase/carnithine racemase
VTEAHSQSRDLGVVRYERDGAIARIVLNWPDRANAQSSEMVSQVDSCLDEARQDYGVKVVIVKGAGKGFCAGHVIAPEAYPEFAESQAHMGSNYQGSKELFLWPMLRYWEFPKPMIAQVHGYGSAAVRIGRCCPNSRSPPTTPTFRCRWCPASASRVARR